MLLTECDAARLHCDSLTENEIVEACTSPNVKRPGKAEHCNNAVLLNQEVVIKYGPGVKQEEAANLRRAGELVDQRIVRVPRFFRFFERHGSGYLLMENIKGTVAENLDSQIAHQALLQVLEHFATISGRKPGPLNGGWSRGLLWEDQSANFHGSTARMQAWYNTRLCGPTIDFEGDAFVLCHLDPALRNILISTDSKIPAVVDWASAGFYPRYFEFYALALYAQLTEGTFYEDLLNALSIDDAAQAKIALLGEAWYNAKRFHLANITHLRSKPEEKEVQQYDYRWYALKAAKGREKPLPPPPIHQEPTPVP